MRRVTAPWLGSRNVAAMGWTERVRREDVAAFEQRVRAEGSAGYRVFDRSDDPPAPARGSSDANGAGSLDAGDVMAVRLIEPMAANAAALGVNGLSVAPAQAAILQAIDTGAPAASADFRLTQQARDDKRAGIVIYQAIYDGDPPTRRAATAPFAGGLRALAMDSQLAGLAGKVPDYLRLCVVEAEHGRAAAPPVGPARLRRRGQRPVRPRPFAALRRPPSGTCTSARTRTRFRTARAAMPGSCRRSACCRRRCSASRC